VFKLLVQREFFEMESLTLKIQQWQDILSTYVEQLAAQKNNALGSSGGYQAIVDREHNHFMLIRVGWTDKDFVHRVLLHLNINSASGNIWVQQNNTEILPDLDLAEKGIHKSDFVIGFRPEWMRGQAGFAVS
jgi:XisI protein